MNKFTIVIPTRERPDTLLHTLKTCVDQDYDNLTILVSDNFSADNTEEVVRSLNDKRIQYIRTPGRLHMAANYDFALDHVQGGYVNFIGDDDGLTPNALKITNQILTECPADAIHSKNMAIYFWPGYLDEDLKGEFQISLKPSYRVLSTQKYFKKSMQQLSDIFLPQLYHGFVKTQIVQDLKKKHITFFNGSSPDLYASVVLGKVLNRHIFSEFPLTIHGLSHHSIGASSRLGHINNKPSEKFWSENPIPFHEKLVMISSTTLVYADAFLQAKKFVPEIPSIDLKNVIKLTAKEASLATNPKYHADLLDAIREVANKNQLSDYADSVLRDIKFVSKTKASRQSGFNPANEILILKTLDLGIKNVFDAFQLSAQLLPTGVYNFSEQPLNEPLIEYFKRGLKAILKKLKN